MKKIFVILFLIVSLFSCGDDEASSETQKNNSGLTKLERDSFSVSVPATWEEIKDKEVLPEPPAGKIELALSSSEIRYGYANNMLIQSQILSKDITSKEYSINNNLGGQKSYLEYTKIDEREVTFASGQKSQLYVFEAKYNTKTPKQRFIQTGLICSKNKAFYMTIAISLNIKDTAKYEKLLESFMCK